MLDKYNSGLMETSVGTGDIALAPAPIIPIRTRRNKNSETPMAKPATARRPTENRAAPRYRKPLDEDLKGAGHQMDRVDGGGEGLADQTPTSDTTGEQDHEMTEIGEEWPRDHNDTEAMCDVDEDGTEHEPQGSHESKHSEADDGIQDKLGHDWPDEPTNSGGHHAEFGNHIKGAELTGWKGPKGEGVPKTVDVDGGRKTEIGGKGKTEKIGDSDQSEDKPVGEDWNPNFISGLMEDNVLSLGQLQRLFDLYARDTRQVTLEGFQELVDAHGVLNSVSEEQFTRLLGNNSEYMFHEMVDSLGHYWISEGLPAAFKKNQKGGKGSSDDSDDDGDDDGDDEDGDDDKPPFLEGSVPAAFKKNQKGGKGADKDKGGKPAFLKGKGSKDSKGSGKDDKPAFLKGKGDKGSKGHKPPQHDDGDGDDDGDDDKPAFLKEAGMPASFKDHQFGKGGEKGGKKTKGKPKKSMKECDKVCKEWLHRAKGIHNALQQDQLTEGVARRALQISLNMGLTRQDLREAPEQTRGAVAQVARSYRLSINDDLQRLAEAFHDFQQAGGMGPGGAPDPFGQAPLGEIGPEAPNDPNDPMGGELDPEAMGGPGEMGMGLPGPGPGAGMGQPDQGGLGSADLGGGYGDPKPPGMPGEMPGGMAGAGGMPNDPAFGDMPPGGGMGGGMDDMGMDDMGMGGMGGPGGMDDMGMDDMGPGEEELGGPNDMSYDDEMGDEVPFGAGTMGGQYGAAGRMRPGMPTASPRRGMGGGMGYESRGRGRRPISEDGHLPGGKIKGGTTMKSAGHQMDHAGEEGHSVASSTSNRESGLPQDDTDTTELKGKDLLGASQKNTIKPSQEFEGGGKGKLNSSDGLSENLTRLGRYLKRYLAEHDHGLRGQFTLSFGTKLAGRPASQGGTLPDILADAEELLLVYGNGKVLIEAVYLNQAGKPVYRCDIPLPHLNNRGPMVADGKVLFRFNRIAEQFARQLVNEGTSCRISSHNWGTAVATRLPHKSLRRVFQTVLK